MIVFMILEANHIFIAYAAALKIKFLRLNKNAVIICLRLVSFSIDLPRLFYTRFLCKLALFSSLIFSILPRKISSQQTFSVGDEHITSRYEYHFSMLSSPPPLTPSSCQAKTCEWKERERLSVTERGKIRPLRIRTVFWFPLSLSLFLTTRE